MLRRCGTLLSMTSWTYSLASEFCDNVFNTALTGFNCLGRLHLPDVLLAHGRGQCVESGPRTLGRQRCRQVFGEFDSAGFGIQLKVNFEHVPSLDACTLAVF